MAQTTPLSPLSDTSHDLVNRSPVCLSHASTKDILNVPQSARSSIYQESPNDNGMGPSVQDQRFLKITTENAHTNLQGNLEFSLPFNETPTYLPNNQCQAKARFNNLLRTLIRKPELMNEYQGFMAKILDKNHALPIPGDEPPYRDCVVLTSLPSATPEEDNHQSRLRLKCRIQRRLTQQDPSARTGPDEQPPWHTSTVQGWSSRDHGRRGTDVP